MKTKTFLVTVWILLLSFSAAAQTTCPDENGDCFLRDLRVGVEMDGLQNTPSAVFSCPEGKFTTGLTIASSVQEFGRDVTRFTGSSFSMPISETNWEVRYIKPTSWITKLHCESGTIDIPLPENMTEDPFHRKTFATTDLRCSDGKVVSGATLLSSTPESEHGKSLRTYIKGVRLACTSKEGGETTYTDILGFDMAESFCKTELINSLFPGNATGLYTTNCSPFFKEWDWEYTDYFERLEMHFAPDRAHGFSTRRKWSEIPSEGTVEENCPQENMALSEITLHYNTAQNNLIGIGQKCREFRQSVTATPEGNPVAIPDDTSPKAAAETSRAPRRKARKPDEAAKARKRENMKKSGKRGSEKIKKGKSPKAKPIDKNPSPKPPIEDEFGPFPGSHPENPGDGEQGENDPEISAQPSSAGGSWFSCSVHPSGGPPDASGLPLLGLFGFWLLWTQKKGKGV